MKHKAVAAREALTADLQNTIDELLSIAALPDPLADQIREDACIIGLALAEMCRSFARKLLVKIEFSTRTCALAGTVIFSLDERL